MADLTWPTWQWSTAFVATNTFQDQTLLQETRRGACGWSSSNRYSCQGNALLPSIGDGHFSHFSSVPFVGHLASGSWRWWGGSIFFFLRRHKLLKARRVSNSQGCENEKLSLFFCLEGNLCFMSSRKWHTARLCLWRILCSSSYISIPGYQLW